MKKYEAKISANLTEDDSRKLLRFVRNAEYMKNTEIFKEGIKHIQSKIRDRNGEDPVFTVKNLPQEEKICQYILAFRFFFADKETSHFPSILKIIGRCSENTEIRPLLKELNKRWKNFLFTNAVELEINEKKITSERILNLWFNGFYFHQDSCKEKELEELNNVLSIDYSKYLLVEAVYQGTKMIHTVSDFLLTFFNDKNKEKRSS